MSNLKEENIFYELAAFLSSNLSDTEAEEKFNNIIKQIEELNGLILETNLPRLEPLAYPIKKETSGYFCVVTFKVESEMIEEIQKRLKLLPEILRFMIVKKKEKPQKVDHQKFKAQVKKGKKEGEKERIKEEKEVSLEELDKKLSEILKE